MNIYIQLAWRNLWRNKRRTIITSASIFFGVVFSSIMTSMQEGSYAQMIKTIVNSYSGYIQVHKTGYWEDKVINNSFTYSPEIRNEVSKENQVTNFSPRLETYALASSADLTKGVMVIGISPKDEDCITSLSKKIISGNYLLPNDSSVLVGNTLAKHMQLKVNDTIVLLSQGYHGVSAAGKYRVKGIIKQPSPELDRIVVYMDINQCQQLFSADNKITSLVIMTQNTDNVANVKKELTAKLGKNYEVKDWKEINQILMKQIDSDRASGFIIKGLLYLILTFGIFGTVMMMTLERRKEFGVLVAVGMQKYRLSYMLLLETLFIGVLGSITGILFSLPIAWYFKFHPIPFTGQTAESMLQMGFEPVMSFSIHPSVFYVQAMTILVISLLIGLYPILVTSQLKVNKALHS